MTPAQLDLFSTRRTVPRPRREPMPRGLLSLEERIAETAEGAARLHALADRYPEPRVSGPYRQAAVNAEAHLARLRSEQ